MINIDFIRSTIHVEKTCLCIPVCYLIFTAVQCCIVRKIPLYVVSLLSGDGWVTPVVMIGSLDIAACVFNAHGCDFLGEIL